MAVRVGRYEIVRAIASGGMATVHLARVLGEGGFERLVALKIMHPHIANDPVFVGMFFDEARLAARIRHPNVVATHDVQKHSGGVFLVMDYIDGPSLQAILRSLHDRDRLLPLEIALRILCDALSGLHAAHELCADDGQPLNLVHRDVSPDNILVGADGLARITDFGVARAESRISTTNGQFLKGKLAFMAPERITSGHVDRRCDVYAAAATLWEALSGHRLFEADDNGMLLTKIVVGPTRSPRMVGVELPEAVEAVIMRALSRDLSARYATASAFADALEEAARSAGVTLATSRQVAAFLQDLKKEGVLATQRAPAADLQAFAMSLGHEGSKAGTGSGVTPLPRTRRSPARARRVLAIAVGCFAIGLVTTLVIVSAGGGGGAKSAASGAVREATDVRPPALDPPAATSSPDSSAVAPAEAPLPTATQATTPSTTAAPAIAGSPSPARSAQPKRVSPAAGSPAAPRRTEFRPEGL